jgi:hypothetical protein
MDLTNFFEGVTMFRPSTIVLALLSIVLFGFGLPAASVLVLAVAIGLELVALKRTMDEQRAAQALRPVRITRRVRDQRRDRR